MSVSSVYIAFASVVILIAAARSQSTFVLNTRQNPATPTTIEITTSNGLAQIRASTFSASRPTKILIHGWGDNYTNQWWAGMVAAFLQNEDLNVIRLDWSKLSGQAAGYQNGVTATTTVGREVATAVQVLISQLGVRASDVHVIGHSLGAQTAGAVGEALKSQRIQLGRITGLDPAGPGFDGAVPSARLDLTDAKIVDTLMTNAGVLGSTQAVGHLNFLPNGGRLQPGCSVLAPLCSHAKALTMFTDTIRNQNGIMGTQCTDYVSFQQGNCRGQPQALMGYRTNLAATGTTPAKFYS